MKPKVQANDIITTPYEEFIVTSWMVAAMNRDLDIFGYVFKIKRGDEIIYERSINN